MFQLSDESWKTTKKQIANKIHLLLLELADLSEKFNKQTCGKPGLD